MDLWFAIYVVNGKNITKTKQKLSHCSICDSIFYYEFTILDLQFQIFLRFRFLLFYVFFDLEMFNRILGFFGFRVLLVLPWKNFCTFSCFLVISSRNLNSVLLSITNLVITNSVELGITTSIVLSIAQYNHLIQYNYLNNIQYNVG